MIRNRNYPENALVRLPNRLESLSMEVETKIVLRDSWDNPVFIRLRQEDGTIAWTSPIYIFR